MNIKTDSPAVSLSEDTQPSIWLTTSLFTIGIFILGIIFLFKRGGKKPSIVKNKGNVVFIMGECASGKTALLYKLAGGTNSQTVSSIESTESIIEIDIGDDKIKKISLIDIPGHNYTKLKYINELGSARGVIFLIDSQNINLFGPSAEYLYTLMIQRVFQDKQIPVLICASKTDLQKALSLDDFKHLLVKEIERVKKSRKAIQEEENDQIEDFIQHQDQEFSFNGTTIKFCQISVIKSELQPVTEFIKEIFE